MQMHCIQDQHYILTTFISLWKEHVNAFKTKRKQVHAFITKQTTLKTIDKLFPKAVYINVSSNKYITDTT